MFVVWCSFCFWVLKCIFNELNWNDEENLGGCFVVGLVMYGEVYLSVREVD